MKIISFVLLLLALGCTIRPPEDYEDDGPEFTEKEVAQALLDAQAGFDQEKAFRVGDAGIWQRVQRVLSNAQILEEHHLAVTQITNDYIYYEDSVAGAKPTVFQIERVKPKSSALASWFKKYSPFISNIYASLTHFFDRFSIHPSTAVGEVSMNQKDPIELKTHSIMHKVAEANLNDLLGRTSLTAQSVNTKAVPVRYFGLKAYKHKFKTNNCAQLADCTVNATHIQFTILTKDANNQDVRIHKVYEISIEVPGIVMVLEECYSLLVKQDGNQIPATECYHVDDFRFGTPKL